MERDADRKGKGGEKGRFVFVTNGEMLPLSQNDSAAQGGGKGKGGEKKERKENGVRFKPNLSPSKRMEGKGKKKGRSKEKLRRPYRPSALLVPAQVLEKKRKGGTGEERLDPFGQLLQCFGTAP